MFLNLGLQTGCYCSRYCISQECSTLRRERRHKANSLLYLYMETFKTFFSKKPPNSLIDQCHTGNGRWTMGHSCWWLSLLALRSARHSQQFQTAHGKLITQRSWLTSSGILEMLCWEAPTNEVLIGSQKRSAELYKRFTMAIWPWPKWHRRIANSMVSIPQVFSHSCIALACDVNSCFLPPRRLIPTPLRLLLLPLGLNVNC